MSYETILCVVVRCDDCHAAAPNGTDPMGRWPGSRVAPDALPGWHTNGATHRCPRCQLRRDCAAAGHQYGPWTPTPASPSGLTERVCLACGADQLAPAYTLTPARARVPSHGHQAAARGLMSSIMSWPAPPTRPQIEALDALPRLGYWPSIEPAFALGQIVEHQWPDDRAGTVLGWEDEHTCWIRWTANNDPTRIEIECLPAAALISCYDVSSPRP